MPRTSPAAREIHPVVVRSIEPVDVDGFLYAYARAILEAKGFTPNGAPSPRPPASTEAA